MSSAVATSSALADILREKIQREGPITFHDWMEAALYDPEHGYYCRPDRARWGREGDYRTSPERSELFAATFARYFARSYEALGAPTEWTIVEAGAGEGRFAAGVLDSLQKRYPTVFRSTRYVVSDVSAESQARAQSLLQEFREKVSFQPLDSLDEIRTGIIFSNELLDALRVRRVVMQKNQLQEFYVQVKNEAFEWVVGSPSTPRLVDYFERQNVQLEEGQIAEVSLAIEDWIKGAAAKLRHGYLMTVDYGAEARELYDFRLRPKGTLRAFKRHRLLDDLLAFPGEQDLTSTINWTWVENVGSELGFETIALERQDQFLLKAGLLEEMEAIERDADVAEKMRLRASAREMILPGGMAESFQVLVQQKRCD
jgi:SAM-dependent MidA family methyltransferase